MDLWGPIIVANKNPWTLNIQSLPPEVNGGFTLPKTNSKFAPENRPSEKETVAFRIPTIHFWVQTGC